jgi:hypothetical protein
MTQPASRPRATQRYPLSFASSYEFARCNSFVSSRCPPLTAVALSPPERVASRFISTLSHSSSSFYIERSRARRVSLSSGPIGATTAVGHFAGIAAYRELTATERTRHRLNDAGAGNGGLSFLEYRFRSPPMTRRHVECCPRLWPLLLRCCRRAPSFPWPARSPRLATGRHEKVSREHWHR